MIEGFCRACGIYKVSRPRGLCWRCYYNLDRRGKFPSESKFARYGVRDSYGKRPLPEVPTMARPGTPAKMAVLQYRASRGQCLFHPDDYQLSTD